MILKNHTLNLVLSPTGHLNLYFDANSSGNLSQSFSEKIQSFFLGSDGVGLLRLGLSQFEEPLPVDFVFWQQFAILFITEVCKQFSAQDEQTIAQIDFPAADVQHWIEQAPFARGIEYLNEEMAKILWQKLQDALITELTTFEGSLENYLSTFHSAWNTIGRVCFHLAENKKSAEYPFAFLATYTTGLKHSTTQHVPLAKALEEYAGKKTLLLSLLLPVHRASEKSTLIKEMLETHKIFKTLSWHSKDAYRFLQDIPYFESAGVMVRVPNWWQAHKTPRPTVSITVGEASTHHVGLNALLDFQVQVSLPNGEELTDTELTDLLNCTEQLIQIKGQWVQVDHKKLTQVLAHWKTVEKQVKKEGLSFAEGLRLLSGFSQQQSEDVAPEIVSAWSTVKEGTWLASTLSGLKSSSAEKKLEAILKKHLHAELRPYQLRGVQWLWWLYQMQLGGCLADDMGLGKTIQMITLFLWAKYQTQTSKPHLLVLPASLLENWQLEIKRFAPTLSLWVAHSSVNNEELPILSKVDIVITTYGTLPRLPWISDREWDMVILDEAQAIKNPATKQARIMKLLKNRVRFALTGTPIENRLLDLWSLFDFIAPGLLGSHRVFAEYGKKATKENSKEFYAAVRKLVNPYILRRLKSDKRIISDLPDKTEIQTYCTLTKQQVGLYQQAVNELALKLEGQVDDINRRGLVMSFILRFKQICNHPTQWLGYGDYSPMLSGKFLRLKELCELIAEKQEKVLVFTQFKEIIPALCEFLSRLFQKEGVFLHGEIPVKERAKRVAAFQQEQGPPFFVLSLKAGGVGLNLTAAAHVIHFDRWWNPAVENQATDRAFRIGQQKNVLVHKFICRGTIEEKIDSLLTSKKSLSEDILGQDNEVILTELSDTELMNMVTLDIHRALGEN